MNEYGKVPVLVSSAPTPIGPYSQAIKAGELVFASGQLGLNQATGELAGPEAASQAKKALEHLQAILEASGSAMIRVVKTTIFLTDMADFAAVNEVYGQFFPVDPPARSTVQVAALPKGAKVEIEAIATCPKGSSQFGGSMF
jgi:2-iminobutanoate/2-iminopropanoate deaminase